MDLNPRQIEAATHDPKRPLLIIAGAGTGKTTTLAHRVAHLLREGLDPERILLLTFTRRAAAEMTARAEQVLLREARAKGQGGKPTPARRIRWSGTFHSVGSRLLRLHADEIGLDPSFTVLDRPDSEDLLDIVREELGLAARKTRFPRKGTCLSLYSLVVNSGKSLIECLKSAFPWCARWEPELLTLFRGYVDAKLAQGILDYDDLLLYWDKLMEEESLAARVRKRFDHVLVDEYQDTNAIQARIVRALKPEGDGVTVVGDDAQSIYSFRAATVRNILDFPAQFDPPATVITLEENYRSTQLVLDACNAVIERARERFTKNLRSRRPVGAKPTLVTAYDEDAEARYVADRVLESREAGIPLRRQAVLMRTSHHSDLLEIELVRRDIPFVKYGGLKFLEASHVKDLLCVLRFAENPRDRVAGLRVLQLLPAIGPVRARRILDELAALGHDLARLSSLEPPREARTDWPAFASLLQDLAAGVPPWPAQVERAHEWYRPHLFRIHEAADVRDRDLVQMEVIATAFPDRERFLVELTLDPPVKAGDEAGPPHLDEDYLVLSTIHSAKGQEWDVVHVIHVADGCIPSDLSTGDPDQIEEERRLLYVAMTRARDELHVIHPHRFFTTKGPRRSDASVSTPLSRFLEPSLLDRFDRRAALSSADLREEAASSAGRPVIDVARRVRDLWGPVDPGSG